MTANAPDTSVYVEDRARNWQVFASSSEPLPDYWERWGEYSHNWKIPIEFLQPIGLERPDFLEPLRPLLDELERLEEVKLLPTGYMHMSTTHVGFLMATDIMWSQVESIYVNAAPRLHRLDPFTLKLGGVSAFEDCLYLGVDDGFVLREVRRLIRLGVPVVYDKARHDPNWEHFIPHLKFAYFTGKGSRQRVVDVVTPYLDAEVGEVPVDQIKMGRVPVDPEQGFGDIDVIAEIGLYGKDARKGYHN